MVEFKMLNNSTFNSVLSRARFDRYLHNCVKMMIISLSYSCLLGLQKSDLSEVHSAQMLITDLSDNVLPKGGRFVQFCDKISTMLDPLHHKHLEEEDELVNLLIKPYKLQYLELCRAQKLSLIQNARKAEITHSGSEIIRKFWVNVEDEPPSPIQAPLTVITKLKNASGLGRSGSPSIGESTQIGKHQPKFGIMMRSASSSTKDIKFSQHSGELRATSSKTESGLLNRSGTGPNLHDVSGKSKDLGADMTRATWGAASKGLKVTQTKKDRQKYQNNSEVIKDYFANSILVKKKKRRALEQKESHSEVPPNDITAPMILMRKSSLFRVSTRNTSLSGEVSGKKDSKKLNVTADDSATQLEEIETFFWNQVTQSLQKEETGPPQQMLLDDLKTANYEYEQDRQFWKSQIHIRNSYNNTKWLKEKGNALNRVGDLVIGQARLGPGYVRATSASYLGKAKTKPKVEFMDVVKTQKLKAENDSMVLESSPRGSKHSRSSLQKVANSMNRPRSVNKRPRSAGNTTDSRNLSQRSALKHLKSQQKHASQMTLLKVIQRHQQDLSLRKFFSQKTSSLPKDPAGKPKGLFGLVRRVEALEHQSKTFTPEANQEVAYKTIAPKLEDVARHLEGLKAGDRDQRDRRRNQCRQILGQQQSKTRAESPNTSPPVSAANTLMRTHSDLASSMHRPKLSPHLRKLMRLSTSMFGISPSGKLDSALVNQIVQKSKIFDDLGKSLPSGSLVSAAANLPETSSLDAGLPNHKTGR